MTFTPEFQKYVEAWCNEDAYNVAFHAELAEKVNADQELKAHRDFVEQNAFGFGDRPFHWVWKLLVEQMPEVFSFLEIGVFQGQVLSLVELLAKRTSKSAYIHGVTTLTNTRDTRCQYAAGDYAARIKQIYEQFNLSLDRTIFHIGKSSDPLPRKTVAESAPFNLLYIDGGHDLADVIEDIRFYAPLTKVGGLLVMDDASIGRLNVGSCWSGLEDVSKAVAELLDTDPRFKLLFAVGHLNVFQRIV